MASDANASLRIKMRNMADLKDPRLIYLKGMLFLLGCILAAGTLLMENLSLRTAVLLGITIWCAARFYYFMFYVIERYVDPQFRFAGVWSFLVYVMRRRTPAPPQPEAKDTDQWIER